MAMTPEEKREYNRQYYLQYRKKGLKKGRKKGSKKTTTKKTKQESLVGLGSSGLNDAGKMQWAMKKKELAAEMNGALASAKTPEDKQRIKQEYQQKALNELQKIKSDPSMARVKAAKAGKSGSSGSGKSGKDSKDKSDKTKTAKDKVVKFTPAKAGSGKATTASKVSATHDGTETKTLTEAQKQQRQQMVDNANELINGLSEKIKDMSPEEKQEARKKVQETISELRKKIRSL